MSIRLRRVALSIPIIGVTIAAMVITGAVLASVARNDSGNVAAGVISAATVVVALLYTRLLTTLRRRQR